jgi:HPt (histidine-containing phosphotransfer) domain-containing protein
MNMRHAEDENGTEWAAVLKGDGGAPATAHDAVDLAVLIGFEEAQPEGEPDLIVELIDLYLAETPRLMSVMQGALAKEDERELRRAAHSLKGSSANLGANGMAALCDRLEHLGNAGAPQVLSAHVSRLTNEFELVRQAFGAERQRRLEAAAAEPAHLRS